MTLYRHIFFVCLIYFIFTPFIFTQLLPSILKFSSIIDLAFQGLLFVLGTIAFIHVRQNIFLKIAYLLFLYLFIGTTILGKSSLVSNLNGVKEFVLFFQAFFIIELLFQNEQSERFVKQIEVMLIIFLIVQVPISIFQFLVFGGGDPVGGTFGDRGMGSQTIFIFVITLYFLLIKKELSTKNVFFSLIFFVPILFNSTKAAIIFAIPWLALIIIGSKKYYLGFILLLLSGIVFFFFIKETYEFQFLMKYVNKEGFFEATLMRPGGRFGKIVYMMNEIDKNPITGFFGNGYGLFKGRLIGKSSYAESIQFLAIDNKPLIFTIGFQGGLVACLIVISVLYSYMLKYKNLSLPYKLFNIYMLFIITFLLIYLDAIVNQAFSILLAFFLISIKYSYSNENLIHSNRKK